MEMHRDGPSYTIDTVGEFRSRLGQDAELFWIIGADSLPELPTWHRIAELVARVQIVTATRPGWNPPAIESLAAVVGAVRAKGLFDNCVSTPAVEISSTQIRERVATARSIRYLTPDEVTSYISANGLYG